MDYDEFQTWVNDNLPSGDSRDDFIEFLAMFGATAFKKAMHNTGQPLESLIEFMFTSGSHLTQ